MSRVIAIGDIHGCSVAFSTLLDAIAPTAEDTIILLGDVIDRGPDSKEALEIVLRLKKSCHLIYILGNHEEMMLAALERKDPQLLQSWISCGGDKTLDSYGPQPDLQSIPVEHVDLMRAAVDYHETETHLFTHGNYDANRMMAEQSPLTLRWLSLRDSIPMRHISGKPVIVAHTPQSDGMILDRGYLKCIDTGCYKEQGRLTALDVVSNQLWQANQLGELQTTAG